MKLMARNLFVICLLTAIFVCCGTPKSKGHGSSGGSTGGGGGEGPVKWLPTSTTNAASGRVNHTAVWAGNAMIVWGGLNSTVLNTGGQYSPITDSWRPVSTTNAPTARYYHSAVYSGDSMIIWGGYDGASYLNSGAEYFPGTDSWAAITSSDAPSARAFHTAVWAGNAMVIWGGFDGVTTLDTGAHYSRGTGSWTATSLVDIPQFGRAFHTAVWTGNEMIVWGGASYYYSEWGKVLGNCNFLGYDEWGSPQWGPPEYCYTGGRYNPATDSWTETTITNAPSERRSHTAVWTGTEMIIWGGHSKTPDQRSIELDTGARYDPSADTWAPTSHTAGLPSPRNLHTAVWTGSQMIIWGGVGAVDTGGIYDPSNNAWTATSVGANVPSGRFGHSAVWGGNAMVVWGGFDNLNNFLNTGGRFVP